jgi:uncharacterized protein
LVGKIEFSAMPACPNCQQPLVILEYEGVEIDHCLSCGGTWLDAGELERIAELSGANAADVNRPLLSARGRNRGTQRRCPRCRKRMEVFSVGQGAQTGRRRHIDLDRYPEDRVLDVPSAAPASGEIELDRCPREHGVWLDRGEMESVVKSLNQGAAGAVGRFFGDLYQNKFLSDTKGD